MHVLLFLQLITFCCCYVFHLLSYSGTWQSLLRCIDFTVPLYKWDKSYVQEHYQSALKIDPMVGRNSCRPLHVVCVLQ